MSRQTAKPGASRKRFLDSARGRGDFDEGEENPYEKQQMISKSKSFSSWMKQRRRIPRQGTYDDLQAESSKERKPILKLGTEQQPKAQASHYRGRSKATSPAANAQEPVVEEWRPK